MTRGGPVARNAVDPATLVAYLDAHSSYRTGGYPKRRRRHINGVAVAESDLRIIRRWRAGTIKGVTVKAAVSMLARHRLSPSDFATWAADHGMVPMSRGRIPA